VISGNTCANELEIENGSSLAFGDKIVIIQMNGAIIDRSNTEKYGDIIDFNGAGQFEFNEVLKKNGKININVCLAFDEKYLDPAKVLNTSILVNSHNAVRSVFWSTLFVLYLRT
jgi:hypothetical protein